jgi:hypothetical protein
VPFTIEYDKTRQVIIGKITGDIDSNVLKQLVVEMDQFNSHQPVKFSLNDYRDAQFSFSIVELYQLPGKHDNLLRSIGQNVHILKRAILIDKKDAAQAKFFENVAVNQGQKVKLFTEESAAFEWLLNSDQTDDPG